MDTQTLGQHKRSSKPSAKQCAPTAHFSWYSPGGGTVLIIALPASFRNSRDCVLNTSQGSLIRPTVTAPSQRKPSWGRRLCMGDRQELSLEACPHVACWCLWFPFLSLFPSLSLFLFLSSFLFTLSPLYIFYLQPSCILLYKLLFFTISFHSFLLSSFLFSHFPSSFPSFPFFLHFFACFLAF